MDVADRVLRLPVCSWRTPLLSAGKHVQGFSEYGPERMGAPITAYNRISEERCNIHSTSITQITW